MLVFYLRPLITDEKGLFDALRHVDLTQIDVIDRRIDLTLSRGEMGIELTSVRRLSDIKLLLI